MNLKEIFDASKIDPNDVVMHLQRGQLPLSAEDKLLLQTEARLPPDTARKVVRFCLLMRAGFRVPDARAYAFEGRSFGDLYEALDAWREPA